MKDGKTLRDENVNEILRQAVNESQPFASIIEVERALENMTINALKIPKCLFDKRQHERVSKA